ncbi:MAG: hypothetical protein HC860_12845 [Alkalinema sp. RU_4_3]|nr:hypothetical protein [Alkalinema sp. RU_4_3]
MTVTIVASSLITSTPNAQAQSISPELKAALEAANFNYRIVKEDSVEVDLNLKTTNKGLAVRGTVIIGPVISAGNLKMRNMQVGINKVGKLDIPNDFKVENFFRLIPGSVILVEESGGAQLQVVNRITVDQMTRNPKAFQNKVEGTLRSAATLENWLRK